MDPGLYEAIRLGNVDFLKANTTTDDALLGQKTPKDNNILHIAAEFKQVNFFEEIAKLDDQSLLFWAANKHGDTPLHVAARVGCDEVISFLIDHSKKKNTTPSEESEREGDAPPPDADEAYKEMLRITNLRKDTAIHVAVQYAQNEAVNLLMAADPELCCLTNNANESPLFIAVRKDFYLIARSILVNRPAQLFPSFEGTDGVTALHAAVTHRNIKMTRLVKIMVKKPDAVGKTDAIGWIPLHYAALKGNLKATRILLTQDSSTAYILDKTGMSPLHVAACLGHTKVLKELIQWRPDACDLLNEKGQNILHSAVLGEQRHVVEYILKTSELGRLINEGDGDGNTPLHLASLCERDNRAAEVVRRKLATHPRVDKAAINNEFSQVLGIYRTNQNAQNTRQAPALMRLQRGSIGVPFFHKLILCQIAGLEPTKSSVDDTSSSTKNSAYSGTENFRTEVDSKIYNTNLLVATLIATVTFAAAFTMPGGYKSNGAPVLIDDNVFFFFFLMADAYSFFTSIFVVFLHFYETNNRAGLRFSGLPHKTVNSLVGMMIAFSCGVSAVLFKRIPLGVFVTFFVFLINIYVCCKVVYMFFAPKTGGRKFKCFSRTTL